MNGLTKIITGLLIVAAFGNFKSEATIFFHPTHLFRLFHLDRIIPTISTHIYDFILYIFEELPVKLDPVAELELPELIQHYGYPVEIHKVVTQDGYVLDLHRIPYGRSVQNVGHRQPIYFQDGITCSPGSWLFLGPGRSLAFAFADAGYDVWLGDERGTTYSTSHLTMNYTDQEYWEFSLHEMGLYDVPAIIDYILQNTGVEKLFHVGHSQGAATFYVMGSLRPEYNEKVIAHFGLGPAVFGKHLKSMPVQMMSHMWRLVSIIFRSVRIHLYLQNSVIWKKLGQILCKDGAITQHFCTATLSFMMGPNLQQLNTTIFPLLLSIMPAGVSEKQLEHYAQMVVSGHFRPYDNRTLLNKLFNPPPPDYPLGKVKVPVHILWARNDYLSSEVDVRKLCKELGNCKGIIPIAHPKFNHLDFLIAKDADVLVNSIVLQIANRYMTQNYISRGEEKLRGTKILKG